MHILIDARMVGEGTFGIARYVRNLVKALAAADCENRYTVLVQNDLLGREVSAPNFCFKHTAVKWLSVQEQLLLPLLIKSVGPDIFHATSFVVPFCQLCRTVVTIHDLIHVIFPRYYSLRQRLYYRLVVKRALRRAAAVIAVSGSTKHDLIVRFGLPAEQIRVVYEAADAAFRPVADARRIADFRNRLGLPDNFILYVGNRKEHKNLATLFAAFRIFKERDENGCFLVITGRSDDRILKLAADNGVGEWLVCVDVQKDEDLALLYNAARVFVFPSFYEGFGLPPLEAMACGVPVLAANAASLPEVVGEAGLSFDPCDAAGLARAMQDVMTDRKLAAVLGGAGKARARSFSWDKCACETLEVYKEAL